MSESPVVATAYGYDGEPVKLVYGPEKCPRPCVDCSNGLHHWIENCWHIDDEESEEAIQEFKDSHPGLKIEDVTDEYGNIIVVQCRHDFECNAVGLILFGEGDDFEVAA